MIAAVDPRQTAADWACPKALGGAVVAAEAPSVEVAEAVEQGASTAGLDSASQDFEVFLSLSEGSFHRVGPAESPDYSLGLVQQRASGLQGEPAEPELEFHLEIGPSDSAE